MKPNHIVGTSIPRFTYDTPSVPGNDFYALCDNDTPLMLIFLPNFGHPISREYITRYLKTLPKLKGVRLACVVRSHAQVVAEALHGTEFPFPLLCDPSSVLYGYFNIEQTNNLLNWSFAARRIFKEARLQGYQYDKNEPQILPLTLVVGREGKILFAHYGRSLTDMPEDCEAITELAESFFQKSRPKPKPAPKPEAASGKPRPAGLASDETVQLPALRGEPDEEAPDAMDSLFS